MKTAGGVAAIVALATIAMTWPLTRHLSTSLPGDYGDPLLVTWAMAWVSHTVTAALTRPAVLADLWNANIFYPETHALAFSEHFIAQSIMALPVHWARGNPILTYNVAFLASFLLSGLGVFLLVRALIQSCGSARARTDTPAIAGGLAAALVMAFNQYRLVYEVAHLHVLSIQWMPFALLGLHRYLVTDSRRALALGALALVALNLSSVYYMAYCAPFVVAFVVVEAVRLQRWRSTRVWLELWAAAAAVAVATAPFVLPYMEVQQRLGVVRTLAEIAQYSATLDHYRIALPGLAIPLALTAVAYVAKPTWRRTCCVMALSVFVVLSVWLSLGPAIRMGDHTLNVPSLYLILHERVPGYDGLRVPARFGMLFFMFLSLLAGLGASHVAAVRPRLGPLVVVAALAMYLWQMKPAALPVDTVLTSPELQPAPGYLTPSPDLPSIYRHVQQLPSDAVLLELPFGDPWYELRYMFFAATHRHRLVNGYSGIFPPSYLARQRVLSRPLLDPEAATRALTGATHVIVHRAAWRDDTGSKVSGWLERIGARVLAGSGDALLYEIDTTERLARKAGVSPFRGAQSPALRTR